MSSETKQPKCDLCGKGPFENLREWVNHRCDRATTSSDTPTYHLEPLPSGNIALMRGIENIAHVCSRKVGLQIVGALELVESTKIASLCSQLEISYPENLSLAVATLLEQLAEARAEVERMKIDAGKAYCVYCGTSGPKEEIWKHVTVCDKHPLKTMADKMKEASGMIHIAMMIFDEFGLSGDATAVTAVEAIQSLKADNERLRLLLSDVADHLEHHDPNDPLLDTVEQALAVRGKGNEQENIPIEGRDET